MPTADPPSGQAGYPFPDDEINTRWRDRERLVCGGYTSFEWNQCGTREIAFACSHGACGWRIHVGTTDSFNVMFMVEFDYADELHRKHAWEHLERHTTPD